jgi:hypothetical protein
VARARLVLALSWIVAIGSGILASRLDVFGDFSYLLPPETESVRHLRALEKRTRVLADYMIGVESDDATLRANAAKVMREKLDAIDHDLVSGVTSDQHAGHQFMGPPLPLRAEGRPHPRPRRARGEDRRGEPDVRLAR